MWLLACRFFDCANQIAISHIRPLGLTPAEFYTLCLLLIDDGLPASELARRMGLRPSSFTPILDKLQREQYITRQSDQRDRRRKPIHLTEKVREREGEFRTIARDVYWEIVGQVHTNAWPKPIWEIMCLADAVPL